MKDLFVELNFEFAKAIRAAIKAGTAPNDLMEEAATAISRIALCAALNAHAGSSHEEIANKAMLLLFSANEATQEAIKEIAEAIDEDEEPRQ